MPPSPVMSWVVPLAGYVVALVVFVFLFKEPPEKNEEKT